MSTEEKDRLINIMTLLFGIFVLACTTALLLPPFGLASFLVTLPEAILLARILPWR